MKYQKEKLLLYLDLDFKSMIFAFRELSSPIAYVVRTWYKYTGYFFWRLSSFIRSLSITRFCLSNPYFLCKIRRIIIIFRSRKISKSSSICRGVRKNTDFNRFWVVFLSHFLTGRSLKPCLLLLQVNIAYHIWACLKHQRHNYLFMVVGK